MTTAALRSPLADPLEVNLRTLLGLRWVTITAEVLLVFAGKAAGWPLAVGPMLGILAVLAVSNVALKRVAGGPVARGDKLNGAVIAFDALACTALLALGGGTSNPFTALYFLHVVAAALLSSRAWTVAVLVLCAAGYGALFRLPADPHAMHLKGHLSGMWAAFVVLGSFFGWAITRLRRELAIAEERHQQARALQARTERLASLATLATGAAHELSTPLGTISVVAHELQRNVEGMAPEVLEDAQLIGQEVERCRVVLEDLAADAGSARGEAFEPCCSDELMDEVLAHLRPELAKRVEANCDGDCQSIRLPRRLLARALRGLVKNGLDASGDSGTVCVQVQQGDDAIRIDVRDEGSGMSPEELQRAGEPFFTTKPTGQGMGLGLFFARSVAQSLGGTLTLHARDPGISAVLTLPVPLQPVGA